jgi:hypothetical protein
MISFGLGLLGNVVVTLGARLKEDVGDLLKAKQN